MLFYYNTFNKDIAKDLTFCDSMTLRIDVKILSSGITGILQYMNIYPCSIIIS